MINPQERLDELLDVVYAADRAIIDIYNTSDYKVEIKADDTPVTTADIAAHQILMAGIARLYPEVPIVSEEGDEATNREKVESPVFWLVDPLDGTREFLERSGHFTVCVGLIEEDVPSFGIISAPALGITYYGGPQIGSFRLNSGDNHGIGTPLQVADRQVGTVLVSRTELNSQTADFIRQHYPNCETKAIGSQLKLPVIAEGTADAYPRIDGPLHLWDLAAGHAILTGAGGKVTKPNGEPISYRERSLMVGDFVARSAYFDI